MKLYRILALAIMALVTGAAMAGTQQNDRTINLVTDSGHLSGDSNFTLNRLPDGSFSDTFAFYTGDFRSFSASLTNNHDIEMTTAFLQDGQGHRMDLSGDSNHREGSLSGGNTGYFTLHVEGTIGAGDAGEYNVHVTAVPEPETFAMLLAGLGIVAWASQRRKTRAALAA